MFRLIMCWLFSDASEEETGDLDEEDFVIAEEQKLSD